jgi:hypothetical protein
VKLRGFMALHGGAAVAWPLAARAGRPFVASLCAAETPMLGGLRQGLSELVRANVDAIVTGSSTGCLGCQECDLDNPHRNSNHG